MGIDRLHVRRAAHSLNREIIVEAIILARTPSTSQFSTMSSRSQGCEVLTPLHTPFRPTALVPSLFHRSSGSVPRSWLATHARLHALLFSHHPCDVSYRQNEVMREVCRPNRAKFILILSLIIRLDLRD